METMGRSPALAGSADGDPRNASAPQKHSLSAMSLTRGTSGLPTPSASPAPWIPTWRGLRLNQTCLGRLSYCPEVLLRQARNCEGGTVGVVPRFQSSAREEGRRGPLNNGAVWSPPS
ncbi:hypothetical protein SKAU_G00078890 [Synaphobranchus kaupii]|uniref:Uncharacterized protein n=1 Tax=Synaphobranchus kaupii TaxID=118154 RepID=A0A9Q1J5A4_SYNKA|nr:hypothetical protein SKAU_G00078890 [Synaphobranchus kaupii]